MSYTFKIEGLDELTKKIAQSADGAKFFDGVFAKHARQSVRKLIETTNKLTGNTARGWQDPKKNVLSSYTVEHVSKDRPLNIARILDKGRGPVYPVRAKRLYIPLTNKGRSKKLGAPISDDLRFGIDYVLAKKAKAFAGTKFIQKEVSERGKLIGEDMVREVNKLYGQ